MKYKALCAVLILVLTMASGCTKGKGEMPLYGNGAGYDLIPKATDRVVVALQSASNSNSNGVGGGGLRLVDFVHPSDIATGPMNWPANESKMLCKSTQGIGQVFQSVSGSDSNLCQLSTIDKTYFDGNLHYLDITPVSGTFCNGNGPCGSRMYNGGPQYLRLKGTKDSNGKVAALEASFCTSFKLPNGPGGSTHDTGIFQLYYTKYLRNDPTQNGNASLIQKANSPSFGYAGPGSNSVSYLKFLNQVIGQVNDQAQWVGTKTMSTQASFPAPNAQLSKSLMVQQPSQVQFVLDSTIMYNSNISSITQVASSVGLSGDSLSNYTILDGVARQSVYTPSATDASKNMYFGGWLGSTLSSIADFATSAITSSYYNQITPVPYPTAQDANIQTDFSPTEAWNCQPDAQGFTAVPDAVSDDAISACSNYLAIETEPFLSVNCDTGN